MVYIVKLASAEINGKNHTFSAQASAKATTEMAERSCMAMQDMCRRQKPRHRKCCDLCARSDIKTHEPNREKVVSCEGAGPLQCCLGAVFEQCSGQCSAVFRGIVFQRPGSTGFQSSSGSIGFHSKCTWRFFPPSHLARLSIAHSTA